MSETENNSNSTQRINVVNCPVCLDDKHISHFFKFRCSHSICKQCYKKLKDKERCFYCRAEIIDKEVYEAFNKLLVRYLLLIVVDLFIIAFSFMTFTIDKRSLIVVFYIEMCYSSFLPFILIKCKFDLPPPMYSNVLGCLKLNWLIFLMFSKNTWWKYIILSVSKVILIYTIITFEKRRVDMGVIYLNDVMEETDYSEGVEV